MKVILLTQDNGALLGPIAKVLGLILNALFDFTSNFGIMNIGLAIILFTIVVKLLMLPLTIKQMKFSKLSSIMNPELQAIQKKYKGKSDQDSMMKMNEEQKAVYEKYGTSPTGGCIQMLIQMPILFALYRVIANIPAYVTSVKDVFISFIDGPNGIMAQANYAALLSDNFGITIDIAAEKSVQINKIIDAINMFDINKWNQLKEVFPSCASLIAENSDRLFGMYDFFGINLAVNPVLGINVSMLIPILAVVTQWISIKTVGNNNQMDSDNPAASSMKTMNTIMPLMSGFFAISLPAGLGLYWVATAVVQTLQQVCLNYYFSKVDMDKLVARNVEKANKKREKKGLPANNISTKANTNARNVNNIQAKLEETRKKNLEKVEEIKKSTEYYNSGATKGSLSSKANMVAKYNEKNTKK